MNSDKQAQGAIWIFVILAICALLSQFRLASPRRDKSEAKIGVVDFKLLLREAPEYPKWVSLDREIDRLEIKLQMEPFADKRCFLSNSPKAQHEERLRRASITMSLERDLLKAKADRKKLYCEMSDNIRQKTASVADKDALILSEATYLKRPLDLTARVQMAK